MVATSQEKPEDGKVTSTEPAKSEGKEVQTVPLPALLEERNRRQAVEKELADLRAQQSAAKPVETTPADQDLRKQVAELQAEKRRRDLARQTGLHEKQTELVEQIMQAAPGLNLSESVAIAKLRDPKLFDTQEGSGFDPSMHGGLGPTRGQSNQPPAKSDYEERVAFIKKTSSVDQMKSDAVRQNMIGGMAAKAMGLPHQYIPIT